MLLDINDFKCSPNILPPTGGKVSLSFKAISAGNPSHLRARFWIADSAPFAFSAGDRRKEIFLPARNDTIAAPTSVRRLGPKETTIVADGATAGHTAPLKVNLDVLGFTNGQHVGTSNVDCLVTIDTLKQTLGSVESAISMALRLINSELGVSQRRIAEILSSGVGRSVSEDLVGKVIRGGSSSALLDRLRGV